jgi:hypothetical protein
LVAFESVKNLGKIIQKSHKTVREVFHKIIYTMKDGTELMLPNDFMAVIDGLFKSQSDTAEMCTPLDHP